MRSYLSFCVVLFGAALVAVAPVAAHHSYVPKYNPAKRIQLKGVMLFASDALALAANISFQLKMALLVVAGINATVFQIAIYPGVRQWGDGGPTPPVVKLAAVLSISLWLSIIALGRLIAYWA